MNLGDLIAGAMNNPNQQANPGEMGGIIGTLNQLSAQHGTDPSTVHSLMSTVGDYVRGALQQKREDVGREGVQDIARNFAGTSPNDAAVDHLFSDEEQQQIAQTAAGRTGVDPSLVRRMLPVLVPLVLKLLHSGTSTQPEANGENPLLNAFLGGGQGDNMDLGSAVRMLGGMFGSAR